MTEEEIEAIETMKHWIEYEKANKDKINKADELIKIQETVLNLIEKKDKIIDEMAKCMEIEGTGRRGFTCMFRKDGECNKNGCRVCIKEYFKKKVEVKDE